MAARAEAWQQQHRAQALIAAVKQRDLPLVRHFVYAMKHTLVASARSDEAFADAADLEQTELLCCLVAGDRALGYLLLWLPEGLGRRARSF